jgi:thiol:disulfide interchange protein DsbD
MFGLALLAAVPVQDGSRLVRLEPVFSHSVLAPGEVGRAGVRLKVESGWHIYWVNPGETGLPTEVSWPRHPDLRLGSLIYPFPKVLASQGLTAFGYEGEAVLLSRVQAAAGTGTTGKALGRAKVRWLVCREACLPGSGTVDFAIRKGPRSAPTEAAGLLRGLDLAFQSRLPGGAAATRQGSLILLAAKPGAWAQGEGDAEFIPGPDQAAAYAPRQRVQARQGTVTLSLPLNEFSPRRPGEVSGVLVLTFSGGTRRFVVPATPIPNP